MSEELAGLLQAGKVRVFGPSGVEAWRMRSLDVIHGEVHLTVVPVVEPPATWTVVVVGEGESSDIYAASSLAEALAPAKLACGAVVSVYEVVASDAAAARREWPTGQRLFCASWLSG